MEPLPPTNYHLPTTILANLPYVPNDFTINLAATHEPKLAIYGGLDGLDLYRKLFEQIGTRRLNVSHIFTESIPSQHQDLTTIAEKHGYKLNRSQAFIQVFVKT